jgi:predicted acyltransferase
VIVSLCYWLIEIKGWKRWSKPFEIFGTNAVAAYFLHVFFLKVQNQIHIPRMDGTPGNLRFYLTDHLFGTWLPPQNASLAYALCYTLFWLVICWVLFRKRIFIKI